MKTQAEMMILVPQKIKEIEQTHGVEILWAVESGSRAWGFESLTATSTSALFTNASPKTIYNSPKAEMSSNCPSTIPGI